MNMSRIGLKREFIARHRLIGDFGAKSELHSHHYVLELEVEGQRLDDHGFLVDIDELARPLDELVQRLDESVLNDLEELRGVNPSMEEVARAAAAHLAARCRQRGLGALTVRVWEDPSAWASHRIEL
jgi:6-pyruvoyltetrahydropterin/6-carboxytetrahydropterin synthase